PAQSLTTIPRLGLTRCFSTPLVLRTQPVAEMCCKRMSSAGIIQALGLTHSLTTKLVSTTRPPVFRQCFKKPTAATIRLTGFMHSVTILRATLTPRLVAPHSSATPLEPVISPWALLLALLSPRPTTLFVSVLVV